MVGIRSRARSRTRAKAARGFTIGSESGSKVAGSGSRGGGPNTLPPRTAGKRPPGSSCRLRKQAGAPSAQHSQGDRGCTENSVEAKAPVRHFAAGGYFTFRLADLRRQMHSKGKCVSGKTKKGTHHQAGAAVRVARLCRRRRPNAHAGPHIGVHAPWRHPAQIQTPKKSPTSSSNDVAVFSARDGPSADVWPHNFSPVSRHEEEEDLDRGADPLFTAAGYALNSHTRNRR
jgi:hypothetical protein